MYLAIFGVSGVSAQVITAHGITVQGIVRSADNTPVAKQNVVIGIRIAEMVGSSGASATQLVEVLYEEAAVSVTTDAFGVFAKVIGVEAIDAALFGRLAFRAYGNVHIRVEYAKKVIMNSKLRPVPYAAVAYNGVAIGTVLPYTGATAPKGYLLCNGADIPDEAQYQELRKILKKTTTPNLIGMFLSGSGTGAKEQHLVPASLGEVQSEQLAEHNHKLDLQGAFSNQLNVVYTWPEDHKVTGGMPELNPYSGFARILRDKDGFEGQGYTTRGTNAPVHYSFSHTVKSTPLTELVIKHKHSVGGAEAFTKNNTVTGGEDVRPFSYGVNYIIKY